MRLRETLLLFLDCQTTGMRPSSSSLLEMAWGWGRASDSQLQHLHSKMVQLPEGESIPSAIETLTGIKNIEASQAQPLSFLYSEFMTSFKQNNQVPIAIIHYAQFEKPFMEDLFLQMTGDSHLPFRILCSQKLARKLFPQMPSQNLRALSGFFGNSMQELKRASSHVQATFEIWKGLVEELQKHQIDTLEDLEKWMEIKSSPSKVPYEYRISKEKRLTLPQTPGIYRMKSKSGKVLYVGKATSLKDRVNSYFRGRKGRDPRKLEMLAQVWDLDFLQTETALEAALLENDEIKKLDPFYNVSLKARDRSLLFYSKNFESTSSLQSAEHPLGPFRAGGSLEQIHLLSHSLKVGAFLPIFFEPIDLSLMREGFEIFCHSQKMTSPPLDSIRSLLAMGCHLLRQLKETESAAEVDQASEEPVEITAIEVAKKFERLLIRGAQELRRTRQLTHLLNAQIEWESEIGWKALHFHEGRIQPGNPPQWTPYPWQNLGILEYDRMSILWSEISKHSHRIST